MQLTRSCSFDKPVVCITLDCRFRLSHPVGLAPHQHILTRAGIHRLSVWPDGGDDTDHKWHFDYGCHDACQLPASTSSGLAVRFAIGDYVIR
jgi:hypothetical protein